MGRARRDGARPRRGGEPGEPDGRVARGTGDRRTRCGSGRWWAPPSAGCSGSGRAGGCATGWASRSSRSLPTRCSTSSPRTARSCWRRSRGSGSRSTRWRSSTLPTACVLALGLVLGLWWGVGHGRRAPGGLGRARRLVGLRRPRPRGERPGRGDRARASSRRRACASARVSAYPTLFQLPFRRVVARSGDEVRVGWLSLVAPRPIAWERFEAASGRAVEAARLTEEGRIAGVVRDGGGDAAGRGRRRTVRSSRWTTCASASPGGRATACGVVQVGSTPTLSTCRIPVLALDQ